MNISVNGEPLTLTDPCSVDALLRRLELTDRPCAVEINTELVPKREHEQRVVNDGDVVEVVTLVGGG